jgi:hypothetical protein
MNNEDSTRRGSPTKLLSFRDPHGDRRSMATFVRMRVVTPVTRGKAAAAAVASALCCVAAR